MRNKKPIVSNRVPLNVEGGDGNQANGESPGRTRTKICRNTAICGRPGNRVVKVYKFSTRGTRFPGRLRKLSTGKLFRPGAVLGRWFRVGFCTTGLFGDGFLGLARGLVAGICTVLGRWLVRGAFWCRGAVGRLHSNTHVLAGMEHVMRVAPSGYILVLTTTRRHVHEHDCEKALRVRRQARTALHVVPYFRVCWRGLCLCVHVICSPY